ncbi:hypothetical protein TNIN_398431 [Trichonephila inaurata madagascariensis]|uniref:Uncharacterized protein n=1 Tax=Trichonephila inaurata madagascariensis TaxID=2747483 RepID=A0A8X6WSB1_9ARAC|nr:hypothetical protein TNIN_398431 [Trichonephila inaurata madagascariensis]
MVFSVATVSGHPTCGSSSKDVVASSTEKLPQNRSIGEFIQVKNTIIKPTQGRKSEAVEKIQDVCGNSYKSF